MKRQRPYLFIILLLTYAQVSGQNSKIIFEQKALDYFLDSILNKVDPFKNYVAHFDGIVDKSITTIEYEMTAKYPDDKELEEEYLKRENATSEFWKENFNPPFQLSVREPIKKKSKKHYRNKSKVLRLRVFQSKNVGIRNFVCLQTFIGKGNQGYEVYFTLDSAGSIINWHYATFIF